METKMVYFWRIFVSIVLKILVLIMEGKEGVTSSNGGITVVGSDAPSDYHVATRSDNPIQTPGPLSQPLAAAPPQVGLAEPAAGAILLKKKRGRPRKYAPDGSLNLPLSPKPISSSAPPSVIDFSAQKRGKVRPVGSVSKSKFEVENLGNNKSYCLYIYTSVCLKPEMKLA